MISVFDAAVFTYSVLKDAKAPPDPTTGKPIDDAAERVSYLLERLSESPNDRVLLPTPVLCEVLFLAEHEGFDMLEFIQKQSMVEVVDFDSRAALEASIMIRKAWPDKKNLERHSIKFDSQILAIAKVHAAKVIYTDDDKLAKKATELGIEAVGIGDLPLRPLDPQPDMFPDKRRS